MPGVITHRHIEHHLKGGVDSDVFVELAGIAVSACERSQSVVAMATVLDPRRCLNSGVLTRAAGHDVCQSFTMTLSHFLYTSMYVSSVSPLCVIS